jgi:hypothetical protein
MDASNANLFLVQQEHEALNSGDMMPPRKFLRKILETTVGKLGVPVCGRSSTISKAHSRISK